MGKTKHKMFSIWKIIGLVIALLSLGYRIFNTAYYFDEITEWWSNFIIVFFVVYLISFITIATSFTRGPLTLVLAAGMIIMSMLLIGVDIFDFLGSVVSLDDTPLAERGFLPPAHILNVIASFFNLIGFLSIEKKEKKKVS